MLICSGLLFQILSMIILDLLRARHWFACDGRHPVNGVLEGIPRRKVPFLSWKYILRTTFNWLFLSYGIAHNTSILPCSFMPLTATIGTISLAFLAATSLSAMLRSYENT